jgi:uncharacterized repeat protein (TIGR02543 family)
VTANDIIEGDTPNVQYTIAAGDGNVQFEYIDQDTYDAAAAENAEAELTWTPASIFETNVPGQYYVRAHIAGTANYGEAWSDVARFTIYEEGEVARYKVVYDKGLPNASFIPSSFSGSEMKYPGEVFAILPGTQAPSGYTFDGWYDYSSNSSGTKYIEGVTVMPGHNVTLYAKWIPRKDIQGVTVSAASNKIYSDSAYYASIAFVDGVGTHNFTLGNVASLSELQDYLTQEGYTMTWRVDGGAYSDQNFASMSRTDAGRTDVDILISKPGYNTKHLSTYVEVAKRAISVKISDETVTYPALSAILNVDEVYPEGGSSRLLSDHQVSPSSIYVSTTTVGALTTVGDATADVPVTVEIVSSGGAVKVTPNYEVTIINGSLMVNRATAGVTVTKGDFDYDGTPGMAVTFYAPNVDDGDYNAADVEVKYYASGSTAALAGAPTDAGTYTAVVTLPKTKNYNAVSGSATYTIAKRAIWVEISNETVTYPMLSANLDVNEDIPNGGSSRLLFDDQVSPSPIPVSTTTVGALTTVGDATADVPVTVEIVSRNNGAVKVNPNYEVKIKNGSLMVNRATAGVTVTKGGFDYNGMPGTAVMFYAPNMTDAGYVSADVEVKYYASGSTAALAGAPVDAGTYTAVVTLPETKNYNAVSGSATYTIAPKPIVVAIETKAAPYPYAGVQIDAALEVTASGLLAGVELEDVIDSTVVHTDEIPVGTYTYGTAAGDDHPVTFAVTDHNYEIASVVSGAYEIASRALDIAPINIMVDVPREIFSKVFGDNDPNWRTNIETQVRDYLFNDIRTQLISSGVTIAEAEAIAGADVLGFNISVSRETGNTVGEYAIEVAVTPPTTGYYSILNTVPSGMFSITPRPITITATDASKTYDGTPLVGGVTIAGLPAGYTYNAASVSSRTEVGSETAAFTGLVISDNTGAAVPLNNFALTFNYGTLTIHAAPLAVIPLPPAPGVPATPAVPDVVAPEVPDDSDAPSAELPNVGTPVAPEREDATVPASDDSINVGDGNVPLASSAWALANLILAIGAAVFMILLWIAYFTRRKEDADTNKRRQMVCRILSAVGAIAAMVIFALTENMQLPMQMIDKYTIWMIAILAVQLAFMFAALIRPSKKKAESK